MSGDGGAEHEAVTRARERDALTALALASHPDEQEIRRLLDVHHDWQPPALATAVGTLAELASARRTPRVRVLQHLVHTVARRGTEVLGDVPALEDLVHAYVEEGRPAPISAALRSVEPPPPPPPPVLATTGDPDVDAVLAGFDAVGGIVAGADPWEVFATRAGPALGLGPAEIEAPRCHDSLAVPIDGRTATRVAVWFRTDLPCKQLGAWTNPATWAAHSLWFESVAPVGPTPTSQDFRATFHEVIRLSDSLVLETDLEVTRTVRDDLAVCRFELADKVPTTQLGIDTGNIVVRYDPHLDGTCKVEVRADKYLQYADPALAAWPTIACDLFWMELCTQMALGYAAGP